MHQDFWSCLKQQWERFRGRSAKRRSEIVGSRCLQGYRIAVPLFYDEERLPYQLLSTNLVWYWSSSWLREVTELELATGLPVVRPFTRLNEETVTELIADLRARDASGDMRTIELVGVDREAAQGWVDNQLFLQSLRMFARTGRGPVQIVMIKIGDMLDTEIFLPHHISQSVWQVLSLLGIDFNLDAIKSHYNHSWFLELYVP